MSGAKCETCGCPLAVGHRFCSDMCGQEAALKGWSAATRQHFAKMAEEVELDTWSSASCQHYIDTGRYLTVGEVEEQVELDHGPGCDGPYNCVCGDRLQVTSSDRRFDLVATVVVGVLVAVLLLVVAVGGARARTSPPRWVCWSEVNKTMPEGVEPMCAWVVQR